MSISSKMKFLCKHKNNWTIGGNKNIQEEQDTCEHGCKHMGTKNNNFIVTILYVKFVWGNPW